ncbi:MAG: phosphotransferase family protein [Denitromonas halophila]|nr:MAG: phosphotransferase family protein [Denitromonas halophila]TVT70558.1 MAG: phosphotransferase family protein [Denitromonas halophila]TVT75680.1 MAG: phosphotransferase family protein [Denitromonas halophila]
MQVQDKNRPDAAWIEHLRARFPCEREIDRILVRKLSLRDGPGFSPVPLETLVAGVEALLVAEQVPDFTVTNPRWLSGGASKLQMAFDLEWQRPGLGFEKTAMVLRMEPAESIVETSRLREFQLIKAFEGVVPVPPVFWCDPDGTYLPYPALIYGFAPGVTKPSTAASGVSGLGMVIPESVRRHLAPQFVDMLARIHCHDFSQNALSAFDVPLINTTQCAEWGVNWWERVWLEDCEENVPMMHLAAAWMRRNLPVLDVASVVHSDYRSGNFLYTEHDNRITALLDWELGRIGDRHQDIAWTTSRAFSSMSEDGKTVLVCGLMPEREFYEGYEKASGLSINPKTVHWYKVFNAYSIATLTLGTGYRIARNGKTHQDILVAWLIGIGGMIVDEMRTLLEEAR